MNLDIRHEQSEGAELVYVTGEIDAYTAPKLRSTLTPLAEQGSNKIIVDLTNVQYIDSTGLGIFVGILKLTDSKDSSLVLTGLSERVHRLFTITGLDEVIQIEPIKGEEAK
ncbi:MULTISPECIES: STAS domain-containing protein [Alkalihalophilus]|jgi:anti-sigma B factor antagonist|uniref:Anti-sigma factor antagonist n=3 Tax=Alkalihalophilus TaxID=2893060 RepID=D3FRY5_ALKPO|nr:MULTISPECIES: STAS domain-containing protein [Alkalihalophilus]ADC49895.1 positive regulator of sigma-B activity [Alkalihalophilus pseudofirmus OF4]ERN52628.1 positive regulator of sigma-B activity [Alkalihalophilus marmarensis DSM 21297]MCM3491666.1 STAS domain-containing protein [Alkalihalophilus marmarensis]MDV2887120.1 STAS domain-containing protein [Alkalihalophilus pseudofirmus]MEC2071887.1 STAS domain-containing protein [Alkalihalophilus marmarensis]